MPQVRKKRKSQGAKEKQEQLSQEEFLPLLYALGIFLGLGLLGWVLTPLTAKTAFSLTFALWFYLILPGYCILLNLNLDGLERVILAFPVSGALIPIALYHWNALGGRISLPATVGTILLASAVGLGLRRYSDKKAYVPARSHL